MSIFEHLFTEDHRAVTSLSTVCIDGVNLNLMCLSQTRGIPSMLDELSEAVAPFEGLSEHHLRGMQKLK